jgi:hypothetical protein
VLVASTIPIAVIVNAFRVALTAGLTYYWGPKMAEGAIHQTEDSSRSATAFALLMAGGDADLVGFKTYKRTRATAMSKLLVAIAFSRSTSTPITSWRARR